FSERAAALGHVELLRRSGTGFEARLDGRDASWTTTSGRGDPGGHPPGIPADGLAGLLPGTEPASTGPVHLTPLWARIGRAWAFALPTTGLVRGCPVSRSRRRRAPGRPFRPCRAGIRRRCRTTRGRSRRPSGRHRAPGRDPAGWERDAPR